MTLVVLPGERGPVTSPGGFKGAAPAGPLPPPPRGGLARRPGPPPAAAGRCRCPRAAAPALPRVPRGRRTGGPVRPTSPAAGRRARGRQVLGLRMRSVCPGPGPGLAREARAAPLFTAQNFVPSSLLRLPPPEVSPLTVSPFQQSPRPGPAPHVRDEMVFVALLALFCCFPPLPWAVVSPQSGVGGAARSASLPW